MDRKQIILDHVTNNPTPKKELCPEVIYHLKGVRNKKSEERYYYINQGKIFFNSYPRSSEDPRTSCAAREETIKYYNYPRYETGVYIDYDESNEMMEFSLISFKKERPNLKDMFLNKKDWEFKNVCATYLNGKSYGLCEEEAPSRFFLFKEDPKIYGIDGEELWPEAMGRKYNKVFVEILERVRKLESLQSGPSRRNLRKFCNDYVEAEHELMKDWDMWYMTNFDWKHKWYKDIKPAPKSELMIKYEELSNIELKDAEEYQEEYPKTITLNNSLWGGYYRENSDLVVSEKINDDLYAIRELRRFQNHEELTETVNNMKLSGTAEVKITSIPFVETKRAYLMKDKMKMFIRDGSGKLVPTSAREYIYGNYFNLEALKENKYCKNILNADFTNELNKVHFIIDTFRHTYMKLLAEYDMVEIAKKIDKYWRSGPSLIEELFVIKPSGKTLEGNFGLTEEQLKIMNSHCGTNNDTMFKTIRIMKNIYDYNMSYMDSEKFKNIYKMLVDQIEKGKNIDISYFTWDKYFWYTTKLISSKEREYDQKLIELALTKKGNELENVFNTNRIIHQNAQMFLGKKISEEEFEKMTDKFDGTMKTLEELLVSTARYCS